MAAVFSAMEWMEGWKLQGACASVHSWFMRPGVVSDDRASSGFIHAGRPACGVSATQAAHLQGVFKVVMSSITSVMCMVRHQGLFWGWTGTWMLLCLLGVSSLSSTKSAMWVSHVTCSTWITYTHHKKPVPFWFVLWQEGVYVRIKFTVRNCFQVENAVLTKIKCKKGEWGSLLFASLHQFGFPLCFSFQASSVSADLIKCFPSMCKPHVFYF